MAEDEVRDTAVRVLLRVFTHGAFINVAVDKALRRRELSERGRRFMTQLVYGTVRHKLLCDYILQPLLRQPMEELPPAIHTILRMGVYQALFLNQVTFPAMVHSSVELAKHHGHIGTARLVNAVLKRTPQCLDDVHFPDPERDRLAYLSVRYSMPRWLVEQWSAQFGPEEASALCAAMNEQAPTALRANRLRITVEELCAGLTKAGYETVKRTPVPEEVTVLSGMPPARAKLFRDGACMLQDPASMLPPHLLEPQPGDWVLDLCAAPGGKSAHLSELAGGQVRVAAQDAHFRKSAQIAENIARMGTPNVFPLCADGLHPPFTEGFFDRVLVDAPCSGLGTLRRHPDLKWRTGPEEFETLGVAQEALLRSAIRLCKNGGLIVYSVCTFSQRETEHVFRTIAGEGFVQPEDGPKWLEEWKIGPGQYQTLPHRAGMDGFYLMRLRKSF